MKSLHKMKCGKGAGVDEIAFELLKTVVHELGKIFIVCMAYDEVFEDWQNISHNVTL